ncbi:MAG: cyclopropane-fatty-acyl-phospholipid synthase family protein [Candidatus Accumulibacter sp.]|uniref:SAM-dependent methyltransferase n=1 Tax=Accumulibacter sp. TaxID=2053492 RepID=UPI0025FBAB16|nr:cyclopropane-fatty-acyl-phospholipid synthase family protein [Accumulibacter sp.]MCM8599317.1 cyclopropane-fatty-acyl-phospholipid synthase family protein [Accumulibacter sp.]MCM8664250.1 cyclopropane-fatty-acyl-phospholipid synthase family protein [Accumulibacter sp.]
MKNTLTLGAMPRLSRDTRTVLGLLEGLRGGLLEVRLPDGTNHLFGAGESVATLQVADEAVFCAVLARGDIGFGEAYVDGHWDTPDLTGLLTLLANNREVLKKALYGSWRALLAARLRHWANRNSRTGSRRNIMAHYDLGNDFYRLWLDETMSYSSALDAAGNDLAAAQRAKYRRILRRLAARPGETVLEIGCGWGGFAEMAAADGLQVTGLTLSPAQLDWARRRVATAEFRLQDYRDVSECYDHVVSIEMFEAVGERWWPTYFRTIARALKPGGRAVVQSIVVRDDLFASYRRGTDFIQQYIFPGGMLPSRAAFRQAAAKQGLAVRDEFRFGRDYARTLAEWRRAFEANWPQIEALGFDARFRRLWRLYLAYCEAGFLAGSIDVVQFELCHA